MNEQTLVVHTRRYPSTYEKRPKESRQKGRVVGFLVVAFAFVSLVFGAGSSQTVRDQFGNATTHHSDGRSSRTVYDQFGNATTHHSDGSSSRTVRDQFGNFTTHHSNGSSSRTARDQFGNATKYNSDVGSTWRAFKQSSSTLGTRVPNATTTVYPYRATHRSVDGTDQPISFHAGALPQQEEGDFERQRRIWEQNAMRRLYEAAQRGVYTDDPHAAERRLQRELRESPIVRKEYNELMRIAGEQYAQQYYNTFGVYPNGSGNHPSRKPIKQRSYFRWTPLFVAIAFLCKWMWDNRHEMKKREFWTARRALTLLRCKKAFAGIKVCMRWLWGVSKEIAEGRILRSRKSKHHACTDQRPEVGNVPDDAIGLKERGKTAFRRICPKWLRVILEGGPKRTCNVCGTENSARAVVCCNCGIAFERPKIKPTQTNKKGCKPRKGPYGRLINKRGNFVNDHP